VAVIYGSVKNIKLYGSGYGSGDGYGSGYGYGDGYGDGYGSGYGYGDGYGSGYGYGDGYGSGYGSGDGSGDGAGSISMEYLQAVADGAAGDRAPKIKADGGVLAFWRSDKNGNPSNGGGGESRKVGTVEELECTLVPCTKSALHATLTPEKWKGERLWVVALYPPVVNVDESKFASLKREIIAEIVPNFYK
jgi:hypothetical protein